MMARFIMYACLAAICAIGLWLEYANRRGGAPRALATAPSLALTLAWALYNLGRIFLFWAGGYWWREPPVSVTLAMLATGIILSWATTALVVLLDRRRHGT